MVPYTNLILLMGEKLRRFTYLSWKLSYLMLCDRRVLGPAIDAELPGDAFWRIAPVDNGESCFLASNKCVKLQDFRVRLPFSFAEGVLRTVSQSRSSFDLFTIPRQQDVFTSIEHGGDNIVRLCSTRDILWMDKRYPNKPLLGYQHNRQYDRSLEVRTMNRKLYSTFACCPLIYWQI
jgi:hypothetical protein